MLPHKSFPFLVVLVVAVVGTTEQHPDRGIHRRQLLNRQPTPSITSRPQRRQTCPRRSTSTVTIPSASPSPAGSSLNHKSTASSSHGAVGDQGHSNGLSALFPVRGYSQSWTTAHGAPGALPLSDGTLRPTRVLKALPHNYVKAPDGKPAMKAHYPQGSYTFGFYPQGGFSFYALGPKSLDLTEAKEVTFGYSVFFEKGFAFNEGGKLPGIYGGDNDDVAVGCSGGSRNTACFSARLMWRTDGAGEFYTYLPPYDIPKFAANRKQCNVPPLSDCNPTYGASMGRGAFYFKAGQWTTISERVRLNDVGKANGELELFVGGKSVINVKGLILRDGDAGRMRGIQMQTFFGGSSKSFASPKDQNTYFSDFSLAITKFL
ncbi:hypothetical protein BDN72DRAFT_553215 [Pluteus cervinus]|uniref:Uncharacterized protein n=1 Tax=Pluteus cervinus TaxID=181527 RepID=A0ACD3A2L6_9AGAR|nr:hypothetical protein BDN72DRAFT_553215 [Pluteus cervinus]